MNKIIVFAGTTEGRRLSEWLCGRNTHHVLCVATEYGEQVLHSHECAKVLQGRLDEEQIEELIREQGAEVVVDATHPFAKAVTDNIKKACGNTGVRYLRLDRGAEACGSDNCAAEKYYFKDTKDCVEALKKTQGNILLTTGSKELAEYVSETSLKERIVARVLPGHESIDICERLGVLGKNIIAMQGPFSTEMNLALIHSYDISVLVTKDSGIAGGFYEKEEAAAQTGIPIYIIGRPENTAGLTFKEVCRELLKYAENKKLQISLIGCGMGSRKNMTLEAAEALEAAEIVFGAERLLKDIGVRQEAYPYYQAKDIIPVIQKKQCNAAVLFSGDAGFYSGASKLFEELDRQKQDGSINADLKIFPGISSVSYLASAANISWNDAKLFSIHGKGTVKDWGGRLLYHIRTNKKVISLLSGLEDIKAIGRLLIENKLRDCRLIAGYQLSYPEQELMELTPEMTGELTKEGLYSVVIINDRAEAAFAAHGMRDSEFIRDKVPMTKEEVREISISKLRLKNDSVLYDIGSGTGSIAVEAARLSPDIAVYAVERKAEAISLIKVNAERFGLYNIRIIEAEAPDGLKALPRATHAFIGGSGGRLREIIHSLFEINPEIRIAANAISLETLQEFLEIEKEFEVEDFEIVSASISRSRQVGRYNLMQGENPVWICSFKGKAADGA